MILYIRWYHWLITVSIVALLALGSAVALEEATYRAKEKQRFITTCTLESVSGASARHCECMWREMRRNHSVPTLSDFVRGAYVPADLAQERDQAFLTCR